MEGLKKMFAVLDVPLSYDFENDDTDHHIYEADNMEAVNAWLIRNGATDEQNSVEEYRVDEDGDFWDGSDYDACEKAMDEVISKAEKDAKGEDGFNMGDYNLYIRDDDSDMYDIPRENR